MQEDRGLQSATDGEFRRTSWHMDFIYQLQGVQQTEEKIRDEIAKLRLIVEVAAEVWG